VFCSRHSQCSCPPRVISTVPETDNFPTSANGDPVAGSLAWLRAEQVRVLEIPSQEQPSTKEGLALHLGLQCRAICSPSAWGVSTPAHSGDSTHYHIIDTSSLLFISTTSSHFTGLPRIKVSWSDYGANQTKILFNLHFLYLSNGEMSS
jgi:hypothetical protein